MQEKIVELIKNSSITVPKLLLCNYKELKINDNELILLMYIINEKDLTFNPKKFAFDLNDSLTNVMSIIEKLMTKDIIKLDLIKANGIRNEVINIDNLYVKLSHLIIIDEKKSEEKTSIYETFEEKFGRTLSPMEYAIIGGWLDMGFSEEIIVLALEESIYNGVYKLNYIDKILFDWKKKGIKNKEDKNNNQVEYKKSKETKKELYDYNWLEENE